MIVNIRGTSGSGKSTIVRELMKQASSVAPVYGVLGTRRPEAHRLRWSDCQHSTVVLGPYWMADTGGCDQLGTLDRVLTLLEKYRCSDHVVCEGVWISDSWGRVGHYFEQHAPDVVLAFVDTPLEECLRRLDARRAAAGSTRALSPTNTSRRYQYVLNVRRRVEAAGHIRTIDISSEDGAARIREVLNAAQ